MILVTAAYGNQGRRLIPRLAGAGVRVRAVRRSPDGAAELRALGAAEVMLGDASDPAFLREAMAGATSVYHVGPSAHPRERAMGLAAIETAVAAGVRHFVYSSALHAIVKALVQHEIKRDVEERLVCSGLNFTILQPADYLQTIRCRQAFETGELPVAWNPARRHTVVDLDDVADVAARVLLEGERHHGATYELCSAGCWSAHDVAAALSTACGRPIALREVAPEERMQDHFRDAASDEATAHRLRVFAAIRAWYGSHDFVGNPNVLTMLLGREPRSLADHVRREFAAWVDGNG